MLLSIIVPTYNQAELLPDTIRSATGRGSEVEVIIIDDGSTDGTARVAEELSNQCPDVRYVFQENQGAAAARNLGIAISKGEYLLFLDTGDELTDAAVPAILMSIHENPECEFFIASHINASEQRIDERRIEGFSKNPEERFVNFLLGSLSVRHGACVSRRSLFDRIQYPQGNQSGGGVPVFAWSLLAAQCVKIVVPLVRVFDSINHCEDALNASASSGMSLVDTIFDSDLVPEALQVTRARYASKRAMSLFRLSCEKGDVSSANKHYQYAFSSNALVIFNLSDTAKYLSLQVRRIA